MVTHKPDGWADFLVKVSIPLLVATMLGIGGMLLSHDNRIAIIETNCQHHADALNTHVNSPHPPQWVAEMIKDVREDIKEIKRDLSRAIEMRSANNGDEDQIANGNG